jgi:hypothetical protein
MPLTESLSVVPPKGRSDLFLFAQAPNVSAATGSRWRRREKRMMKMGCRKLAF